MTDDYIHQEENFTDQELYKVIFLPCCHCQIDQSIPHCIAKNVQDKIN